MTLEEFAKQIKDSDAMYGEAMEKLRESAGTEADGIVQVDVLAFTVATMSLASAIGLRSHATVGFVVSLHERVSALENGPSSS